MSQEGPSHLSQLPVSLAMAPWPGLSLHSHVLCPLCRCLLFYLSKDSLGLGQAEITSVLSPSGLADHSYKDPSSKEGLTGRIQVDVDLGGILVTPV